MMAGGAIESKGDAGAVGPGVATPNALLARGTAGTLYQVKILMLYAFDALVQKKRFELHTEATGFGKFDDLVLWLDDCIQVLQAKHSYKPDGQYQLLDLIGEEDEEDDQAEQVGAGAKKSKKESKKAVLRVYFSSWMQLESLRLADRNNHFRGCPIEYLFFTNHRLTVEDGLAGLYDHKTERFSENFLTGQGLGSEQHKARKEILSSIYIFLQKAQKEVESACAALITDFKSAESPVQILVEKPEQKSKDRTAAQKAADKAKTSSLNLRKKLLTALRERECIEKTGEKKYQRDYYRFTDKFTSNTRTHDLPNVLKKLRTLLGWSQQQLVDFRFATAEGNFFNPNTNEQSPTAVTVALYTGHFGPHEFDLLSQDFPAIDDALFSRHVLPAVAAFFEQFTFKIGQPNEKELTELLEQKVGAVFNTVDPTLHLQFYEFMLNYLVRAQTAPMNDQSLEAFFQKAKALKDHLSFCGHGRCKEELLTTNYDSFVPSSNPVNAVLQCLDSGESITIIQATHPLTATLSIVRDLKQCRGTQDSRLKEGEYVFMEAKSVELVWKYESLKQELCKMLIIDQANLLPSPELQKLVVGIGSKKLILLCANEQVEALRSVLLSFNVSVRAVSIADLSPADIGANLAVFSSTQGFMMGPRFISFSAALQSAAFMQVMGSPYYLAEFLKELQPIAQPTSLNLESVGLAAGAHYRIFVKPTLRWSQPLYRLRALLDVKRPMSMSTRDAAALKPLLAVQGLWSLDLEPNSKLQTALMSISPAIGAALLQSELLKQFSVIIDARPKTPINPNELIIFITDIDSWNSLAPAVRTALTEFKRLIFVGDIAAYKPLGLLIQLNLQEIEVEGVSMNVLALHQESDYCNMPTTDLYYHETSDRGSAPYQTLLIRRAFPFQTIILSDYGSGKSHLTEELLLDHANNRIDATLLGDRFEWVVRIPMKTLFPDLLLKNRQETLSVVAAHYLRLPPAPQWQTAALACAIQAGNVLWDLDGFDEMLPEQREECRELIALLVSQPYCIVASRPSAHAFIPLQPNYIVEMQPFSKDQITEFVGKYFQDDPANQNRALQQIETWQDQNRLALLGKPLLCRIACDILRYQTIEQVIGQDVTLATLFDQFFAANLRKLHHARHYVPLGSLNPFRKLYNLSGPMLARLKTVAYAKLFGASAGEALPLEHELDHDLMHLGIMTKIEEIPACHPKHYIFDHQTQIEYFAALAWVDQLLAVPAAERATYVSDTATHNLYNAQLRVVWQFVAGIVTAVDAPFIVQRHCLKSARDTFFHFLMNANEDLGFAYQRLMSECVRNMNPQGLADRRDYQAFCQRFPISPEGRDVAETAGIITHRGAGQPVVNSDRDIIVKYAYRPLYVIEDRPPNFTIKEMVEKIDKWWPLELEARTGIPEEEKQKLAQHPQKLGQFKVLVCQLDPVASANLIALVKESLFKRYQHVPNWNSAGYQRAYALITAMLDVGLMNIQECVEHFTHDFTQKECLLDALSRLKKAGLLTEAHIDQLFAQNHSRFWDLDAGLPAILLFKEQFCEAMKSFLVKNIVTRAKGDWEIDRAYEVLEHLAQERWSSADRVHLLLSALIEIRGHHGHQKDNEDRIHNYILAVQDRDLLLKAIGNYMEQLTDVSIIAQNTVAFLSDFAKRYQLAVILKDQTLLICGEMKYSITLPNKPTLLAMIPQEMRRLRNLSVPQFPAAVGGASAEPAHNSTSTVLRDLHAADATKRTRGAENKGTDELEPAAKVGRSAAV